MQCAFKLLSGLIPYLLHRNRRDDDDPGQIVLNDSIDDHRMTLASDPLIVFDVADGAFGTVV